MIPIVLLVTVSIIPFQTTVMDRCDVVEVNHFYDDQGKHVFDQVIWYDFNRKACRFEVRDWRLVKEQRQVPINGRSLFWDGLVLRDVRARTTCETWTQYDPELTERGYLSKDHRKGLSLPTHKDW